MDAALTGVLLHLCDTDGGTGGAVCGIIGAGGDAVFHDRVALERRALYITPAGPRRLTARRGRVDSARGRGRFVLSAPGVT